MSRTIPYKAVFYLLLIAFIFYATPASASEGGMIRDITNKFDEVSQLWHNNLREAVFKLFWLLAFISFTYNAIIMAIRGADLPDIILELTKFIIITGIWIYIINNSLDIANAIINSFTKAANIASGVNANISPGDIINRGLELANQVIGQAGFWGKIIYGILAFFILLAYLYIAATLLLVLIESYFVTGFGIILLGFSGSPWTSDIAKKYLIYTVGVGIKLFVTIMVISFGEQMVRGSLTTTSSIQQIFAVAGVLFILAYLTKRIPEMAQSMLAGVSNASAGDIRGMMAAPTGMAATLGVGAAVSQAMKAAKSGVNSSNDTGSDGGTQAPNAGDGSITSGQENDKGAIPEAAGGSSSSAISGSSTNSTESFSTSENTNLSATVAQQSSSLKSGLEKMKNYVANSTVGHLASGITNTTIDKLTGNNQSSSAFDVARKIRENSLNKKIDGGK